MSEIEVTTQAQLDKELESRKPGDVIVCLGGTWDWPLQARDAERVRLAGSSHAVLWGSSHAELRDSSHAELRGSSHADASPYAALHKMPGHTGKITGGVVIEVPEVTTPAEWVAFHGLKVTRGLVTVYKAVSDDFKSGYGFAYTPGSKPACTDWNDRPVCGGGLHFTAHPLAAKSYMPSATRFMACPVRVAELVVIDDEKVKAPRVAGAIFEVDARREQVAA